MVRVWSALIIACTLGATGVSSAATLIMSEFSKGVTDGWKLNGNARVATPAVAAPGGGMILRLTADAGNQGGSIWTTMKHTVPSFSFIADIRIRHGGTSCPADGHTMVFAPVEENALGALGGSLGLYDSEAIPTLTALEFNTWYGQGLGSGDCNDPESKYETVSFAVINPGTDSARNTGQDAPGDATIGGAKVGQTALPTGIKIVNGGFYRVQWNVDQATRTMTAFMTGLEEANKQHQKVKVLEVQFPDNDAVKNLIGFEGRFGMTAATGGATQITEVAAIRIDAPMIAPL
jgi:hypothetical protein